jgi:hypothetical protein
VFFALLELCKICDISFLTASLSQVLENYMQIPWIPGSNPKVLLAARESFKGPFFTEIVILAYWCIGSKEMVDL